MIRGLFLAILVMFPYGKSFGQTGADTPIQDSIRMSIEDQVIQGNYDSATLILNTRKEHSSYDQVLGRIIENEQDSYADYVRFYESATKRVRIDYRGLKDFLATQVKPPASGTDLDLDYVWLKWYETENAANGLLDIDLANKINAQAKDYIAQFTGDSDDLQRAQLLADMHQLRVWHIGGNIDAGYELSRANEKISRSLQDTTMLALTSFHVLNYLYRKRDLKGYIELAEEIYTLDGAQTKRSPYYYINIENLLGAYSFMGGEDEKSLLLANELHENLPTRYQSYFSYLEILETVEERSGVKQEIFKKFGVSGISELVTKLNRNAEGKTDSEAGWRLAQRSARLLVREGEKEAAIDYIQKTVKTLQDAYSTDLSRAIADYETDLINKEKEQEVALEKEKTKTSIVIAGGTGLLLVLAIMGYLQKNKQNREISEKSEEVARQRDEISKQNEEKELLLKEIHHRVKNNLQVISSLLDLQSRGIEDEEALATFMEGQNRVKAMALIHQKLYQNENLATIDFAEYAKNLMKELSAVYPMASGVKTSINTSGNSQFDIDTAVPLGLILNELISNAYKHAFNEQNSGVLRVSVESLGEGKHQMTVSDTGSGLPDGFDFMKAKSLGLRLVRRLAKQLYGKLDYEFEEGSQWKVSFVDFRNSEKV
ncbi:MAG: hypothetical protein HEP71_08035 [Roseivirga sp.]|nr:hypothetical protein [Roseivirga sp.]